MKVFSTRNQACFFLPSTPPASSTFFSRFQVGVLVICVGEPSFHFIQTTLIFRSSFFSPVYCQTSKLVLTGSLSKINLILKACDTDFFSGPLSCVAVSQTSGVTFLWRQRGHA